MNTLEVTMGDRKYRLDERTARALIDVIDRVDYAYGECGSEHPYGDMKSGGLHYCVADKVVYVKKLLNEAREF